MSEGIFARSTLFWLVGLAVGSFLLSFVLVGYGEDLSPARSLGADTYSYSAIGHRGLRAFLERLGLEVFVSREAWPTELGPRVAVVAAEPIPGFSMNDYGLAEAWQTAWTYDSPFVLVLPKWIPVSDGRGRRLVGVEPMSRERIGEMLAPFLAEIDYAPAATVRRSSGEQTMRCTVDGGATYRVEVRDPQLVVLPPPFQVVVDCDGLALVAHRPATDEDAEVWLISDPDVLNNHGLLRGDHAPLVRDLFLSEIGASSVVFEEMLHGYGAQASLIAELVRFPLVLAMLHALLVGGLVVWSGSVRVGKPRADAPRFADGKRTLIDNAAKLLGLGGHSPAALHQYYEQTLGAVGARYFLASDLELAALESRLQAIATSRGIEVDLAGIRGRIEGLSRGRRSAERAVKIAGRLHRWRSEMTHER